MATSTLLRGTHPWPAGQRPPRVAAVMFPLGPSDAESLHACLGASWLLTDAYSGETHPDVVIVRPCSPQTIVGLRRRFPDAVLAAVEEDETEPGLSRMPGTRMLEAGLDRYAGRFEQLGDLSTRCAA